MRTTRLLTTLLTTGVTGLGLLLVPVSASAEPPDHTPPSLSVDGVLWPTFFPAEDGYKDTTRVAYTVSDDVSSTLEVRWEITDAEGAFVRQGTESVTDGSGEVAWDGDHGNGDPMPTGNYTLTLDAADEADNHTTRNVRLTVDRAELVDRTFRRRVSAASAVVDRQVGRCATLRRPSLRRWEGSLGYYSNTRCDGAGARSYAATVDGMLVPRAFEDPDYPSFYGPVRINHYGAAARSRERSRVQVQYWNARDERWSGTRVLGPRLGNHPGRRKPAAPMILRQDDGAPFVLWNLLTANGHRYDVKHATLVLRYQVLRDPDGTFRTAAVPSGPPAPGQVPTVR